MPAFLTRKKLVLFGMVIVLLVAIPLTVYLVGQQQKTKSSAVKATNLTFTPSSKAIKVGDTFSIDANMDPGVNQVSFVKVLILYDSSKLAPTGTRFTPNTTAFKSVLQGPSYSPGVITVTLSIGGSPQDVIQKPTKLGTIMFEALETTGAAPTQISYDGDQTQILSIGATDQFNEDVLSSANPANITISDTTAPTNSPTPTTPAATTLTPTITSATLTPIPTTAAIATATLTPTPTTSQTSTIVAPVCTSLVAEPAAGTAPHTVNLTVDGSSTTSTISKVAFNFGDGQTLDVTAGGSNAVNLVQSHIYTSAGTYTATALLTDAAGTISTTGNCSATITVDASTQIAANPSPLPPTGPAQVITFGTIGIIIAFIGALLLFAL